ncbi:MAG: hypothetical protein Q6366_000155 [Candidatus Freyarchaeota archaeon]
MQTVSEYFSRIKNILSKHPIIIEEEIFFEAKTNTAGVVKGKLAFTDGSKLEFAEYIVVKEGKSE